MRIRPVLLIIGCGDVGMRLLRLWQGRGWRVRVLTSSPERVAELRAAGAVPLIGNLDDPAGLARLAGLADAVVHLAPPPSTGASDPRTRRLLQALARRLPPERMVYVGTSGVYGDCAGEWVQESRPLSPQTDRARRRVHAEALVRDHARRWGCRASVLRAPGIYALDREGGDPRARVLRGSPSLLPELDGYTNHIHADDLARLCLFALFRAGPLRAFNANDDGDSRTGDHYDAVADACGLPRPERISWEDAHRRLSPMQLSFWSESRRLDVSRRRRELRCRLRYPTVLEALRVSDGG